MARQRPPSRAKKPRSKKPDVFGSVLDLCKAGALPSTPLTWHYRSQHEALITYSNYRFYDGELHTFQVVSVEPAT